MSTLTGARSNQRLSFSDIAPDGVAFSLGIALAWYTGWQTTDLIWSLWLSSLLIGYLTITLTIIGGINFVAKVDLSSSDAPRREVVAGIGLFMAIFLLVFFSVHFCAFHAGHASFLSSFFPVPAIELVDFHEVFMNPVGLLSIALTNLLPVYGIFMIPMLIAERRSFINAFGLSDLKSRVETGPVKHDQNDQNESVEASNVAFVNPNRRSLGHLFADPYRNVIRMHLLIIAFAVLQSLELDSWVGFMMVYSVYFF
ncbi:MAG: hypothetical protein VW258_13775, partial [Thalassolituus sp.]